MSDENHNNMKKTNLILLFLLFFTGLHAEKYVGYYRRFYIDARQYQLRTEIPISKEKALKTNAYKVTFDENDRIVDVRFLEQNFQRYDNSRFTGMTVSYADSIEKRTFVDYKNKSVRNRGVYSYSLVLNDKKQPIKLVNFDAKGYITEDTDGVAIYIWTLDDKGRHVSETYLDKNYTSVWNKQGFYEKKYTWNEDKENYIVGHHFFDNKGKPIKTDSHFASIIATFDKATESLQSQRYFDVKNQPTIHKDGFSTVIFSYDTEGNETERHFLDRKEQPAENEEGIAKIKQQFDTLGNIVEQKFYGKNSALKAPKSTGIARVSYNYDARGKLIETSFYDADGQLAENHKREAVIRRTYDENGKLQSIRGYNAKNQWVSEQYSAPNRQP